MSQPLKDDQTPKKVSCSLDSLEHSPIKHKDKAPNWNSSFIKKSNFDLDSLKGVMAFNCNKDKDEISFDASNIYCSQHIGSKEVFKEGSKDPQKADPVLSWTQMDQMEKRRFRVRKPQSLEEGKKKISLRDLKLLNIPNVILNKSDTKDLEENPPIQEN